MDLRDLGIRPDDIKPIPTAPSGSGRSGRTSNTAPKSNVISKLGVAVASMEHVIQEAEKIVIEDARKDGLIAVLAERIRALQRERRLAWLVALLIALLAISRR